MVNKIFIAVGVFFYFVYYFFINKQNKTIPQVVLYSLIYKVFDNT